MYSYAILDGARMLEKLDRAKELNTDYLCLYNGMSLQKLESIAPHIFFIEKENEFTSWLQEEGWGKSWGIFINSEAEGEDLFNHFKKFITVFTEKGKEYYFRFYDPRALRIFLPTCDAQQLIDFFGPVDSFLMEDANPDFELLFKLINYRLHIEKIPKKYELAEPSKIRNIYFQA